MSGQSKRKNVTMSIDSGIHKDFKLECLKNDNEMSLMIENFMKNYISASRKLHAERKQVTNE